MKDELRQRRTAPQSERFVQPALVPQSLEAREVEFLGLDTEYVTRRLRGDALTTEQLAQVGDMDLQPFLRGRGRRGAPERVDQPVGRHDSVRVEHEGEEQRTLLLAAEVERSPVRDDFQRPKDPELHSERR